MTPILSMQGYEADNLFLESATVAMSSEHDSPALPLMEFFAILVRSDGQYKRLKVERPYEALHCKIDFGGEILSASVRNGKLTEKFEDIKLENWTRTTRLNEDDSLSSRRSKDNSYWSATAIAFGKEHTIKVGHRPWMIFCESIYALFRSTKIDAIEDQGVIMSTLLDMHNHVPTVESSNLFEQIVKDLTYYFRSTSNEFASGETHTLEQFFRVQWLWLLVPFFMTTMNIAFVLAVRLQSHRLGLPSWRNSALALMLGDRSNKVKQEHDGANTVEAEITLSTGSNSASASNVDDCMLIGPPISIDRISELERWAMATLAILRSGVDLGQNYRVMRAEDDVQAP